MLGSISLVAAHPSFVNKCASDSITCQLFELEADVGESEVAKRRNSGAGRPGRVTGGLSCLVLSCLLTLYTAVMSFEILFPFGLWVIEPDWLRNHSQLV